ncbi:MAG: hypothetical protein KY469_06470 [Actinobacteria bacterium]|nr:hypothetical protein [Actinomycetota bacterium]
MRVQVSYPVPFVQSGLIHILEDLGHLIVPDHPDILITGTLPQDPTAPILLLLDEPTRARAAEGIAHPGVRGVLSVSAERDEIEIALMCIFDGDILVDSRVGQEDGFGYLVPGKRSTDRRYP